MHFKKKNRRVPNGTIAHDMTDSIFLVLSLFSPTKSLSLSLTYGQAPIKGFLLPVTYTHQRITVRWPRNGHPQADVVSIVITWVGGHACWSWAANNLAAGLAIEQSPPHVYLEQLGSTSTNGHYPNLPTFVESPKVARAREVVKHMTRKCYVSTRLFKRFDFIYIYCLCLVSFVKGCIFWDKLWKLLV